MIILIIDVEYHFNCSPISAAKIIRSLMRSPDVCMEIKGVVDFKFCGLTYTLTREEGYWIMVRSTVTRSTNLDDVL
uniref:33 kDa chaperonin n=1 Tax=Podoviridae sp. cttot15 TaxID=2827751 RepID=A0A8S5TMQ5_9CAUD|nr:MAG TPA: 33 kDa chaperonin [Podoviridae sp. cttot15]